MKNAGIAFFLFWNLCIASAQDKPVEFEGTKAGERKELERGIALRWCPPGTFTMGSPGKESGRDEDEDQVSVTFSSGFWLGETEITEQQWGKLMEVNPHQKTDPAPHGAHYPTRFVTYYEAESFCERLTIEEVSSGRLPKRWKYSLPTEAQWEYACRAGTTTRYSSGDDSLRLNDYGWWGCLSKSGNTQNEKYAHEVGLKKANSWGLQDMHGNVWEWCLDRYSKKLSGDTDPHGPLTNSARIVRGGSWRHFSHDCRSATRSSRSPDVKAEDLGFRIAVARFGE